MDEYSFGNWIKRRRKALDLTQQDLAELVGCSHSLIFKIEADNRRPSRQIAGLIAEHLAIPDDQRELFLKIARQDKNILGLDAISPPRPPELVPASTGYSGNLPSPPTPLVGRDHELRVITGQLLDPACRMLTLTGPGGIGKTRLAIEAGSMLQSHFADGVCFISMAGVGLVESIVPTIAVALGMVFSGPAEPLIQLSAYLRKKEILLVIDNMEHLVAGAGLLGEILQLTEQVKILLTSREQLHLQWEWLFEVQGLPIPEGAVVELEGNSAMMLFVQRARQVSPAFSLEAEDIASLVKICKLVGGSPLAIELAASWARMLSCREIAAELETNLDILETKNLDVPLRHRSIKAVFEHSWKLLSEQERTLMKKLSVFHGRFTREAARAVANASLVSLSSLVDKSLVRYDSERDRYNLHELIQQYTYAQFKTDPDEHAASLEKFALYYADWISELEMPFKSSQQPEISQLIRSKTTNWLASWDWAVDHQRLDVFKKMGPCLSWYFEVNGYYDEALSVFKAAWEGMRTHGAPAKLKSAEQKSVFASILDQVGWFEFRKGNVGRGADLLAESLEIAQEYNDPEVLYYIYGNWGYLSLWQGETAEAERLTIESLELSRELTPWHTAIPLSVLGIVAYQQGKLKAGFDQLSESLKIWRTVGDPRGLVFCMMYLGMVALALKDYSTAESILSESNAIAETNKDRWAHAFGLDMLGLLYLESDRYERALANFEKSYSLSREIGDEMNSTQSLVDMGRAHAALGAVEQAIHLYKQAYPVAREANWFLVIVSVLISFIELKDGLSPETKLAVAFSALSHPGISPNTRERCEKIRQENQPLLTAQQIKTAEQLARKKTIVDWADEIILQS